MTADSTSLTGAGVPSCAGDRDSEFPLVRTFRDFMAPADAFRRLCHQSHCLFLDSSLRHFQLGRYTFLTADPFDTIVIAPDHPDPLAIIRDSWKLSATPGRAGLPPFQGGLAGLFAYEMGRSVERVSIPAIDEFSIPAVALGLYDIVVAWDHQTNETFLISQGLPALEPRARRRRAQQRLDQLTGWLEAPEIAMPVRVGPPLAPIATDQYPMGERAGHQGGVTSNFSRTGYEQAVQQAIDYIRAGDVFQVNLSQRLLCEATRPVAELYLKLRHRSPSTFGGFFDFKDFQIVSASPERFLSVVDGAVETRPIKGTRRCTFQPEADLYAAEELQNSEKDRAENVMICDLMRNDLSRVCQPDSVRVTQLCGLETYGYVQHLVSAVRGELRDGCDLLDLIAATFPGGSITGAPKIRAMEIITELEQVSRGAYCGSLGYLSCNGSMDLNLLIRTITSSGGWYQLPVGGGIVAQSSPRAEYEETWHKAEGLLRALR